MFLKEIVIFVLLLVSTLAGPLSLRIVNGTEASVGEFPYMVSYRYYNYHICGGTIITRIWMLTAAHCIYVKLIDASDVLFGSIDAQDGIDNLANVRSVAKAIPHSNFEMFGGNRNDIGLVKLVRPLDYSEFVRPVILPPTWYPIPGGQVATLVGWGFPKDFANILKKLHKVDILVFSAKGCKNIFKENYTEEVQICAGIPEGGKGQCTGDSGGPLEHNGMQIGIVSWSIKPCASKGNPGMLTRVSSYLTWIFSTMSQI